MSPDAFHQAAMLSGLDAVERATESAGDLGDATPAVERAQLERTRRIASEHRLQLATDAALAAHCQSQVSRAAVVTLATRLHDTHAQHHPGGTTWLTCVSEVCEESRRLYGLSLQVTPTPSLPVPDEVVAMLASSLLCRAGEVITPEVASERARNAACWVLLVIDGFRQLARDLVDAYERDPSSLGADELEDHVNHARSLLGEIGGER